MKNFRFFLVLLLVATLSLATMAQIPTPNLQLWLKADEGVDTLNGKASRWRDQSGKGNDAIQFNTVRQPLFVGGELNQKPVLRFDGFDDKLGFTGSTPMSQFTLFMVVKNYSGGGEHNSHVINFGPSGGDWNQWFFVLWGGLDRVPDLIAFGEGSNGGMFASAPNIAANGEWRIISIVYQTKFNTKLRWNGNNATMTVLEPGPSFFGPMGDPTGSGGGIAGADGVPNGNLLMAKCDFAEAIVYDTLLTDSEILVVENYLSDKYDIILGVDDQSNEIPSQFTLEQNYPNPFNPLTTIKFQVPNSSFVNLKVYDVLGNEVATLVNEEKATGSYEVNFDAKGLSSGIYFYRINAGSFVETKKMIVLK
jgi:Secretion system C-terminal sorting domain